MIDGETPSKFRLVVAAPIIFGRGDVDRLLYLIDKNSIIGIGDGMTDRWGTRKDIVGSSHGDTLEETDVKNVIPMSKNKAWDMVSSLECSCFGTSQHF